ncbi:MAG: hypothetical protein OXM56_02930 [Gammaproteobacteria bacterium]|nr:hypothetical protein [Gammaproteobacteria bacterium]
MPAVGTDVEGGAVGVADVAPLRADGARIAPASLRYRIAVIVDGEEFAFGSEVSRSRESWRGTPVWRVETRARVAAGELVDTVYLNAPDLVALHRNVRIGEGRVMLDLGSEGVSGVIVEPGGEDRPVTIPTAGPVVGHLDTAFAGAALAPGFEAHFRTLDLERQQIHEWRANVTGVESVDVPAGRFGAYRLELVDVGGSGLAATVWMSREPPRWMVRSELTGRDAGGRVVAELESARD